MRPLRLHLPGLVVFAVALGASGVLRPVVLEGLPSTPLATLVLVPVLRALMFIAGALALGGATLLLLGARGLTRSAVRASLVFAGTSATLEAATLADVMGAQWWQALNPTMLRSFVTQIDEGRYLATQVVLGLIAAWVLSRSSQPLETAFAVITLAIAVTLPGYTGHSAAAVTHWVASATMVAHLLAMSLWIGGVLVLLIAPDESALLRFSRMVRVVVPVLLVSGVASVLARINDWASLPGDPYALVLLLKLALTAAVLWLGVRTRRGLAQSLAVTNADVATAVRRSITVEGMLMVAVLGLAVVLARLPNP